MAGDTTPGGASPDAPSPASPDASLTAHADLASPRADGLTYPWGAAVPGTGEAIRIADSVRWVRIPLPGSLGHINSWLLDDADAAGPGYAAVDTGMLMTMCSDAWKALFTGALDGERLTRVVCTHLHPDHIGLAGWLAKRFDAPLHMTRGEWLSARNMIYDVRDEQPDEVTAAQRGAGWDEEQIAASRAGGWGRFGKMVFALPYGYRRMIDGQTMEFGRHRWRVVVGSGHSPEHACLLNEADGLLVSGDQVLPRISSNISLHSGEPEADPLGDWLASIDRLLTLPADLIVLPAHGEPFTGLPIRLAAMRDEHLDRLDALERALAGAPLRAVDCFGLLFRRTIGDNQRNMATGEALAHLRQLEVTGRAHRESRDGVWWWGAN
jgi:glyoxylase-like metal-dependent hydrolase (beta-lactamase superfamily II)